MTDPRIDRIRSVLRRGMCHGDDKVAACDLCSAKVQALADLDAIERELNSMARTPAWLDEALNSGDGSYKP